MVRERGPLRLLLVGGIQLLLQLLLLLLHTLQLLQHLLRRATSRVDGIRVQVLSTGHAGLARSQLTRVLVLDLGLRLLVFVVGRLDSLLLGLRRAVIVLGDRIGRLAGRGGALRQENYFLHRSGIIWRSKDHVVELRSVQQACEHCLRLPRTKRRDDSFVAGPSRNIDGRSGLGLHRA